MFPTTSGATATATSTAITTAIATATAIVHTVAGLGSTAGSLFRHQQSHAISEVAQCFQQCLGAPDACDQGFVAPWHIARYTVGTGSYVRMRRRALVCESCLSTGLYPHYQLIHVVQTNDRAIHGVCHKATRDQVKAVQNRL